MIPMKLYGQMDSIETQQVLDLDNFGLNIQPELSADGSIAAVTVSNVHSDKNVRLCCGCTENVKQLIGCRDKNNMKAGKQKGNQPGESFEISTMTGSRDEENDDELASIINTDQDPLSPSQEEEVITTIEQIGMADIRKQGYSEEQRSLMVDDSDEIMHEKQQMMEEVTEDDSFNEEEQIVTPENGVDFPIETEPYGPEAEGDISEIAIAKTLEQPQHQMQNQQAISNRNRTEAKKQEENNSSAPHSSQSQAEADEEAKRQFGIGNVEVAIPKKEFQKVMRGILMKTLKPRKRKAKSNSDENDDRNYDEDEEEQNSTDAELERELRSANRLLNQKNPKKRKIVDDETKESEGDTSDQEEDIEELDTVPSSSHHIERRSSSKLETNWKGREKKRTKSKHLLAKSMDESSDDDPWISKESQATKGKNKQTEKDEEITLESDMDEKTDNTSDSAPITRKMTREQYKHDKTIRELLNQSRQPIDFDMDDDMDADNVSAIEDNEDEEDRRGNEKKIGTSKESNITQRKITRARVRVIIDTDEEEQGVSTDGFEVLTEKSFTKKKTPIRTQRMTAKKQHTVAKKEKTKGMNGRNKTRGRNKIISDSDDDEDEDKEQLMVEEETEEDLNKLALSDEEVPKSTSRGRRQIPKHKLAQETREAEKAEKERRKRLEERQREFNGIELVQNELGETSFTYAGDNAPTQFKKIELDNDMDMESDERVPVRVHPSLVRVLKKHQAEGIQFLYNCTIESLSKLDEPGGGCILGHCMGLGKTLQIITFLHTCLMHPKISKQINKVLVVVPKNVILNWMAEFEKWLYKNDPELDNINYTDLDSFKTNDARLSAIERWIDHEGPAVLIIGYDMYRNLTLIEDDMPPKNMKKKLDQQKKKKKMSQNQKKLERMKSQFRKYLHEGPHMVICDEGHKLKNVQTGISLTMQHIKTKRRVCMTGTPLQNNLEEYYCMVNFVKPNLLGTLEEYKSRFANIIKKGRSKDASALDVMYMKRRCHILFERLKGVLDRRDYDILRDSLPPKQEYVIFVRLTQPQIELYRNCLKGFQEKTYHGRHDNNGEWQSGEGMKLINMHISLYRIWTHPYLLIEKQKIDEYKRMRNEENAFIDDADLEEDAEKESSEEEKQLADADVPSTSTKKKNQKQAPAKSQTHQQPDDEFAETPEEFGNLAKNFVSEADRNRFELSYKLSLLMDIIKKCEEIGDKLLVFSQFLCSIGIIERMLWYMATNDLWFSDGHQALMAKDEQWGWFKGLDYDIIDGSVSTIDRDKIQTKFNDPLELRNRVLLISTKAGSLGTNLIGANRVVIFDSCWNPSHDTQSLFRVYRFGQVKPVYIYRFIAQGTMEEKIYNRQVTKESIAKRVTQSVQIQRHYTNHELDEMYEFNPEEILNQSDNQRPLLDPPKDRLLGDIILKGTEAIVNYHTHDVLFDELEDEKLDDQDREEAWREYERERQGMNQYPQPHPMVQPPPQQMAQQQRQEIQQQPIPSTSSSIATETATIAPNVPIALQQQQHFEDALNYLYQMHHHDAFYKKCIAFNGMSSDLAMKIYQIKQYLCHFINVIPQSLAGTLNTPDKLNNFFTTILNEAIGKRHQATWIYHKALVVLQTLMGLVKGVPGCVPGINYAVKNFPEATNVSTDYETFLQATQMLSTINSYGYGGPNGRQ